MIGQNRFEPGETSFDGCLGVFTRTFVILYVPVHDILVFIAYAKAQTSCISENITRAFAARIYNV